MGGGRITPVQSTKSSCQGEMDQGCTESGFFPCVDSGGPPLQASHPPASGRRIQDSSGGGESGRLEKLKDGQASGDVSISIAKPADAQNTAKGAKPASVDPDDDDEQNELEVVPSGESIFDMMGVDSLANLLPSWKKKTLAFVDGVFMSIVMTLLTILVLFLDDMRLACFPSSADDVIVIVTIICLIAFLVELGMMSAAKPGYLLGFYFWLDFVSTLSLLGDIPQFIEAVTGQEAGGSGGVDDSTTLARAGRTSRAGTRAGRIARVMRLIRLVRLVKLYRHFESNKDQLNNVDAKVIENDEKDVEESRVGQKLSDLTTRRVIIGVLGMLFILPFFEIDGGIYGENSGLTDSGLEMIHESALVSGVDSLALGSSIEVFEDQVEYSLGTKKTSKILSLLVTNVSMIYVPHENYRAGEVTAVRYSSDGCEDGDIQSVCLLTEAIYDMKWYSQMNALLNIGRTMFIILVLGLGALLFSNDANILVLRPLERMIQKVRQISENPLARQAVVQDIDKEDSKLETRVLENSIMKICSLLAVGFGDAGAEVIAENMKKAGALDPMVPGRKMVAIFGFCDIRQFTDTTEVLQEEVMKFVNNIAQIVHTEVALHGGAANKNIGDAFLLVWKFPRGTRVKDLRQCNTTDGEPDFGIRKTSGIMSDQLESQASGLPLLPSLSRTASVNVSFSSLPFTRLTANEKRQEICKVADNALASFVIIHAALKRTAGIQKYSLRDDLNKRMPNFAVKMGFGLHVGWAIEGAIGSEYKVDASYLSPNVNMASRLEAATKQFGVSILLSSDFVKCLSQQVRARVRQIDCVTVKGSLLPMGLYTFDISLDNIPEAVVCEKDANDETQEYTSFSRVEYENEWEAHPDLSVCWGLDYEFMDKFTAGYDSYTKGNWDDAKTQLEECLTSRKDKKGEIVEDGPSSTLLGFMSSHNFKAPHNWEGFRELTEK